MLKKSIAILAAVAILSVASITTAFAADGDSEITRSIRSEIKKILPINSTSRVTVFTSDGTVYLRGRVTSFPEKVSMKGIAESTPGVTKVVNQLKIRN